MEYKLKLSDLKEIDDLYYVGDLIDLDGSGWVGKAEALEIIQSLNEQSIVAQDLPELDWDDDDFFSDSNF